MLAEIARYRVVVLRLRPRRGFHAPAYNDLFLQEEDTFFGYSYKRHREGKYFDLWFNNPKEKYIDNFVTFGRINFIEESMGPLGAIYTTKFGRFYVEELCGTDVFDQGCAVKIPSADLGSGRSQGKARVCSSVGIHPEHISARSTSGLEASQDGKTTLLLARDANFRIVRTGKGS